MFGGSLVRAPRAEDLQDHGHGDEGRRAGDRPQRLAAARASRRASPVLGGYAEVFQRNVLAIGRHPADQPDHGPVRGRRGLFAGDDRLHLHGEGFSSYMFVTGPDVVKTVTNEVVTQEELGGAVTHTTKSGVADVAFENDIDALLATRDFFDFLPLSNRHDRARAAVPRTRGTAIEDSLDTLIPPSADHALRHARADPEGRRRGRFLRAPAGACRATSSPASAGSRGARSASSPTSRWCWPACSTSTRRRRRARFVRFCDAFDIPILTFVDVPGFLPGVGAGASRDHQARREIAVRLCRGDGAQDHRDHAQGLWRRL